MARKPAIDLLKAFVVAALLVASTRAQAAEVPPATSAARADEFSWLESRRSERSLSWASAQNNRTLTTLRRNPRFERYYSVALELAYDETRIPGTSYRDGLLRDGWIYNLWKDAKHPRGLWQRAPVREYQTEAIDWQVLLDLDALSATQRRSWELQPGVSPCLPPRYRRCMLRLSDGGARATTMREYDVETRSFVPDGFVLPEASTQLAVWEDAETLLVATDFGAGSIGPGGWPLVVKRWSRGQRLKDATTVFRARKGSLGVTPRAYVDTSGYPIFVIAEADSVAASDFWRRGRSGQFQRMSLPHGAELLALHKGQWVFLINEDWKLGNHTWKAGSFLSVSDSEIFSRKPLVHLIKSPKPRVMISKEIGRTSSSLLIVSTENVRGVLETCEFNGRRGESRGWTCTRLSMPDNGSIRIALSDPSSRIAFVTFESFLHPTALFSVDVVSRSTRITKQLRSQFVAAAYVTEQLEARSKDGTRVPYFVTRARNPAGRSPSPTLIHAYGAYGVPELPQYSGSRGRLWLEQGGVYVLANVRGGGELGPGWHVVRSERERVYEDLEAVATDLVARGIAAPKTLAIHGHSAGGLLAAVSISRRPDLFAAAILEVAVLDLKRWDLALGETDFQQNEFGRPSDPRDAELIERTSPFQNLKAQAEFPEPLIMTTVKDTTVHPAQSRRYAAKLESLGMPFLYFESEEGGHGMYTTPDQQALYEAILYTYLAEKLLN